MDRNITIHTGTKNNLDPKPYKKASNLELWLLLGVQELAGTSVYFKLQVSQ
jgi:hypothetical protein